MQTKMFEVRDRMTFIAVVAVSIKPANPKQSYLLMRSGFNPGPDDKMVYLFRGHGSSEVCYDPIDWDSRTLTEAHRYIADNFDMLADGDVIDVEFILGEKPEPKKSEQEGGY